MPLKTPKPPKHALAIISDAMRGLSEGAPEATRCMELASAAPEEVEAGAPHQVFSLDAAAVEAGDLSKAVATGWRYLMMQGDRVTSSAELDAPGGTRSRRAVKFSHFNQGPFVQETVRAMAQAECMDEVAQHDFEFRILRIPELYVMALWLHGEKKDMLVPMPPTNARLNPNQTYTAKQFFSRLRGEAKIRAQFDDAPIAPKKTATKKPKKTTKKKKRGS